MRTKSNRTKNSPEEELKKLNVKVGAILGIIISLIVVGIIIGVVFYTYGTDLVANLISQFNFSFP